MGFSDGIQATFWENRFYLKYKLPSLKLADFLLFFQVFSRKKSKSAKSPQNTCYVHAFHFGNHSKKLFRPFDRFPKAGGTIRVCGNLSLSKTQPFIRGMNHPLKTQYYSFIL